ncbi:hypothetical protein EDD18DRAFT_1460990 [Armillaria luteobubalina]|uniref:Uncharacterized protein n=1 Tax=Armillaria luteobubalina TaxID=153913 RepID=A0AA39UZ34_9AGAR|nr:hypothetical protein EDD18DRAFT_1460990 [Armillaria luteobubalina]
MVGYHNVTIDNTVISDNLTYLPVETWTNNATYNASHTGETRTLSFTKDPTGNVTFIFPEAANAFYYYGIRPCCGGLYAICIDCDFDSPTGRYESIDAINAINISEDGRNPPVVLYSKTFDTPGVHKVTLSNQQDTRFPGGNSQLTVDRFVLQVPNDAPGASQSSTTSKAPIGATVGGILAGIAAISLCFIIWLSMRRRHHTRHGNQPEHNDTNTSFYAIPYEYSPFIIPGPRTKTSTAYVARADVTSDSTSRKRNRTPVVAGASVSNSESLGHTHPSSSRMASSERLPRRETDAGRIDFDDDDDDLRTLPPEYEDIFRGGQSVARRLSHRLPTRPEPQRPLEGSLSGALGQPPSQPIEF